MATRFCSAEFGGDWSPGNGGGVGVGAEFSVGVAKIKVDLKYTVEDCCTEDGTLIQNGKRCVEASAQVEFSIFGGEVGGKVGGERLLPAACRTSSPTLPWVQGLGSRTVQGPLASAILRAGR